MAERRKMMQGSVENFFKVFDEVRRRNVNVDLKILYKTFWIIEININNKTVLNLKGQDTNILYDNAASKLLQYLRSN